MREGGKRMLFNNNDFDFSFFEIPGNDFKLEIERNRFVNPKEGFQRGNMMSYEYEPYKNYSDLKLIPKCDREQKLLKVMEYAFAVTDLNLYLDLHPEDKEAYALFQQYIDEGKRAAREFTSVYGPIVMTDAGYKNYEWDNNPWPWDNEGGNLYV
jgi:spore coat protein JB